METLFNSPDKFKSNVATVDGYKTHYIEAGKEGSHRVLLVHGGAGHIGNGLYRWFPTVIPLSKYFHVFAIDELGSGDTDPPRDPERDLEDVSVRAKHVIDFIVTLKLAPISLVGQSQGGWIVTYITVKRPDLVDRLVIIDSGSASGSLHSSLSQEKKEIYVDGVQIRTDSEELPYFKEVFEPGTMLPKEGRATTREGIRKQREAFFYNKAMVTDEYLDYLDKLSKKWAPLYMKYRGKEYWKTHSLKEHHEMYYFDGKHIRDWVPTIKKPTLVVWGKNSNKGLDPGVELFKRIPDAQMHIFDKANHFLWCDQWKDFNSLVTWFLTKGR